MVHARELAVLVLVGGGSRPTSPSNLRILKLRLLILSDGEPGKQFRQFPKEVMRSRNTCAMVIAVRAQDLGVEVLDCWVEGIVNLARCARRLVHGHLSRPASLSKMGRCGVRFNGARRRY